MERLWLPMSALATVVGESFNGKFTAKIYFPIGYFIVPLLMLAPLLILWKLHSWNLIKSTNFVNISVKLLSYRPLNSATHIFTCPEHLLTISDHGRIAGVYCPNQIENHHFVICWALTSYLSLNFLISNNHTELQSRSQWTSILFCCPGQIFTELSRVTLKAGGFSGVLHLLGDGTLACMATINILYQDVPTSK